MNVEVITVEVKRTKTTNTVVDVFIFWSPSRMFSVKRIQKDYRMGSVSVCGVFNKTLSASCHGLS